MKTIKTCSQHPTCSASDSYLPLCKCWCAECKDYMKAIRTAVKLSGGAVMREIAISAQATAQLFTAEGKLTKGAN
jgi:hypothetical protein